MNILITGIHGFVGINLVSALKTKHTIYGLDIVTPQKDGVFKTYIWGELEQIPPVDVIIHLAGKAHDTKNTSQEQDYFDINVGLTQKIFEYLLKSDAKKFIFFSSVKAVADEVVGDFLSEDAIPNPQTPYGKSKQEAEKHILTEMEKWRDTSTSCPTRASRRALSVTEAKNIYILRPCMIHGHGNKGNLNLLYKIVSKGIPWPLGAFQNKRSMVSIDNLTWVIQQIIAKDIEPGIYNIADDESISTNGLIELVAKSKNKKARIWEINKKAISQIAKLGDSLHLPLNSERLKKLTESYVVSNKKLKNALSIKKMPVTAAEGMRKTLRSFK